MSLLSLLPSLLLAQLRDGGQESVTGTHFCDGSQDRDCVGVQAVRAGQREVQWPSSVSGQCGIVFMDSRGQDGGAGEC